MRTIILNSSHVVNNGLNDTFVYQFPTGSVSFKDDQLAVCQISMYYSWFNINSSLYGNNSISYTWTDGTVVNIAIPDGFYTIEDLNAYLQSVMYSNNHYLISSSGSLLYYLELVTNPTYYCIQLNSYAVPTALPAGWSKPGVWALPAVASTPQFTVSSNFSLIVGMNAGTYPSVVQATTYAKTSDFTPQVSPVSSVIMACNLVKNTCALPSTLLYSFSPNVSFGSQIVIQPPEFSFVDITDGAYTELKISLYDQDLNRMHFRDPNVIILLTVRNKSEIGGK